MTIPLLTPPALLPKKDGIFETAAHRAVQEWMINQLAATVDASIVDLGRNAVIDYRLDARGDGRPAMPHKATTYIWAFAECKDRRGPSRWEGDTGLPHDHYDDVRRDDSAMRYPGWLWEVAKSQGLAERHREIGEQHQVHLLGLYLFSDGLWLFDAREIPSISLGGGEVLPFLRRDRAGETIDRCFYVLGRNMMPLPEEFR
jgi:hypothetical protein